jgi:hypothetical protein
MGLSIRLRSMRTVLALVALSVLRMAVPATHALCTLDEPTWQTRMDQDVFYKCLRRLSESDRNGDDWMDRHEFTSFLKKFAWSLYVVSPFPNGTIAMEQDLFESLVQLTGDQIDQDGKPIVDIWGSNMDDVSSASASKRSLLWGPASPKVVLPYPCSPYSTSIDINH